MSGPALLEQASTGALKRPHVRRLRWRVAALLPVVLLEGALISFFFVLPPELDRSVAPIDYLRDVMHAVVLALGTFCLIVWPDRGPIYSNWLQTDAGRPLWRSAIFNLVVFVVTAAATIGISIAASRAPHLFWAAIAPYLALLGLLAVSLAFIVAPYAFWRRLIATSWVPMFFAAFLGLLVLGLSEMAKGGWSNLAAATFSAVVWILELFQQTVVANPVNKELGINEFVVTVGADCSGYEGIALVTAFLIIYMAVFRRELAFPNALLLFPIGIATIWIFNAVRIAALIAIGAYVSPFMAINGFHSQAGWISFLLVTAGIMALAYKVSFFRREAGPATRRSAPGARALYEEPSALHWLAPFIALMAASITAAAFSPHEQWFYVLRIVAVGTVLWLLRDFYATLVGRISWGAIVAGLAVGAIWIATDPDPAGNEALREWLASIPGSVVTGWLILRAIGSIVFIPIAEELAFRGYVQNTVAGIKSTLLSPQSMALVAIAVSSVLFGLIHQRWLAGMLAGLVYAVLAYRSGRVADAVGAHAASNAIIIAWAYYYQQWSLI